MNTKFFNHYPREWDTLGNEWKEIITGDVLSISQASELSGFSKRFIYAQIHSMKLLSTDKDPLSKQIYSKVFKSNGEDFLCGIRILIYCRLLHSVLPPIHLKG